MLDFQNNEPEILEQNQEGSLREVLADDQYSEDEQEKNETVDGDNEYLTTSVQKTNVKRGTLIVIGLFVIGAVGLFLMIKKSTPQTASAVTVESNNEIDMAIAKLSGIKAEMFKRMDNIAKKFEEFSSTNQVAVDDLQRNPFKMHSINDTFSNSMKRKTQRSVTKTAFELDSIMQSPDGNFCMIDGNIFYIGDYVNEYKVTEIGRDHVKLSTGTDTKILEISMP